MVTLLLLLLHIAVCLVLILVVLLQTGKRADLAGAFGGGGSQTAFGARGAATFLSKATTWSAVIFMVTSIVLGVWFGRETTESVVTDPTTRSAPAPQAPPPPGQATPPAPDGGTRPPDGGAAPETPPSKAPQEEPAEPPTGN